MPLHFRALAITAAIVCFALSLIWLLAPQVLMTIWGIEYSDPVGLVGRRSAALFLGIGIMFLLARNSPPSRSRAALSTGFVIGCVALAALGAYEYASGHAGPGILSAVLVELSFALGFGLAERRETALAGALR
jgi:hypothetical protein